VGWKIRFLSASIKIANDASDAMNTRIILFDPTPQIAGTSVRFPSMLKLHDETSARTPFTMNAATDAAALARTPKERTFCCCLSHSFLNFSVVNRIELLNILGQKLLGRCFDCVLGVLDQSL